MARKKKREANPVGIAPAHMVMAQSLSKYAPDFGQPELKPEPKKEETKPAFSVEEEIQKMLTENPQLTAAAFLNALKAKGIGFADAVKTEADSGSSNVQVLRGQKKEAASVNIRCNIKEGGTPKGGKDPGVGPTKFKVIMLQEGMGNMRDCFYYTKEALQSAVPIFTGKKIFANHPSAIEEESRPERDVRDILGYFEDLSVETMEDGRSALVGNVNILKSADKQWAREMMAHATEYAKKFPESDLIGLSINAAGDAQEMPIDQFLESKDIPRSALVKIQKAKEQGAETLRVVSAFNDAISCDLVTTAGAGGKVVQIMEQEKTMKKKVESKVKEADPADQQGHDDAAQDVELIKKMIAKHLGEEACEDEAALGAGKEAYEAYKAMGCEGEEAMEKAGMHLKAAAIMGKKKEASDKDADDKDKEEEKKEADEKVESEEKKESEKKLEAEVAKLRGELTAFREADRKREFEKYIDQKLAESKLPRRVTDEIRKVTESAKDKKSFDTLLEAYKAGFGAAQQAGSAEDLSDLFVMTEKAVHTTESKESKDSLTFGDCV